MQYNKLGETDIEVSDICLGSMTWGTQNTEAEAHDQIEYALANGINFIDTAEMYPVNPISAETQGATEQIIGNWFKTSGRRKDVILATKETGAGLEWVQNGIDISAKKIRTSIEGSFKRLQTDYIDLYQLHWPNRGSYHFRQNWDFDPTSQNRQKTLDDIYDALQCLGELVAEGKIRHIGLSNESCWGTSQYLQIAEANGFPRIASIQNEYSLMCRLYDLDLAELSQNENISLLPYSPLACGMLTGKYRNGARPVGSRITIIPSLHDRINDISMNAADSYVAVAEKHGLNPAQMAIAFCNQRPFVASSIIGATSVEQLKTTIAASGLRLQKEVLQDIREVYHRYPMPF